MSALAQGLQPTEQSYLVRVDGKQDIIFAPITKLPSARNYYKLDTCTKYKYSEKQDKFVEVMSSAILFSKHGENTHKLEGFKAPTLKTLLNKVAKRIAEHYLHIQLE